MRGNVRWCWVEVVLVPCQLAPHESKVPTLALPGLQDRVMSEYYFLVPMLMVVAVL